MAHYLFQASYTPDAWRHFLARPQNRMEALQPVLAKLGGRFDAAWFAFGDHDVVAILNLPDHLAAGAFAAAVMAGGALKSVKTTPLIEMDDGMAMIGKAAECGYRPPE